MIGIVSHDSGGAELISSYLKHQKKYKNYLFNLSGPAKKIFRKKIGICKNTDLNKLIKFSHKIIVTCGSIIEKKTLKLSISKKIKTILVLDSWLYYKERLIYKDGSINYPDEIWVFDKHAHNKAKKIFRLPIKLKRNFYLHDLKKKFIKKKNNNILYFCYPDKFEYNIFFKNKIKWYKELIAIKKFVKILNKLISNKKEFKLILRLHPKQNLKITYWKNYYRKIFEKDDINVKFSKNKNLIDDLSENSFIVGSHTQALYFSKMLYKKTFSLASKKNLKNIFPEIKLLEIDYLLRYIK